jgi:MFS family permease
VIQISDPILPTQSSTKQSAKQPNNNRAYRFWPIHAVAFARTFSYTIYGLALPNYLIYFQHIAPGIIGLIIAAYSLAFIFGPLAALPITKKFGIRNTVIFSTVTSVLSVGLQLILFDPLILIVLRALDGFFVGFFWPNLQMEISNWQRVGPKDLTDNYFRTYANSWNTGILSGQVVGYIIIFFGAGNEFAALISSWIAMISMIPMATAIEKSAIKLTYEKGHAFAVTTGSTSYLETQSPHKLSIKESVPIKSSTFTSTSISVLHPIFRYDSNDSLECKNLNVLSESDPTAGQKSDYQSDHKFDQKPDQKSTDAKFFLAFPALFYLMGTLIYAYIKSFYPFIYPLYLADALIPSYWVYLITFGHQIVQMIFIALWSTKNAKSGFKAWWFAMGVNILCSFWLTINANVLSVTVFFILNGLLSAFFYNFTSKIMLQYGNSTGSLKYATFYEFYNGIGFGFSALISGLISDYSLALNFPVLLALLCGVALILGVLSKNAVKFLPSNIGNVKGEMK